MTTAALISALACAIAGFLGGALFARRRLARLREGFRQAHDGILDPVDKPRHCSKFLYGLYEEYNQMILMLRNMFSFVEDCQERFLSERNKMNVIVQSLPLALVGVDDDLQIQTTNRQADHLFEESSRKGGLTGLGLFDVLALNDSDREILRDAFLYKQNIRNQVIAITLGEKLCWLTVNLSFVTEQEHDMTAVMTLLDITDYKHLQESAYNREKLVAMGQLAAGVAHELNTPLGSIVGYSQLLMEQAEDSGAAAEYAVVIKEEARRCSHIVHNLLSYARKEQCHGESCDVNLLVEEVLDTFIACRLKRERIEVIRDLAEGELLVEGGCGELDIVITNLLVNALQALRGRPDGRIRLASMRESAGWVCLSIEDNGSGIAPEVRSRIFEPFFTTKDVGEGSGLGLSISHAMVAKRGGQIRYDSSSRTGARFEIRLPCGLSTHREESRDVLAQTV